jgi:hypothetical protein
MRQAGAEVATVYGLSHGLEQLERWGMFTDHLPLRGGITPPSPRSAYRSNRHGATYQRFKDGISRRPAPLLPGFDLDSLISGSPLVRAAIGSSAAI